MYIDNFFSGLRGYKHEFPSTVLRIYGLLRQQTKQKLYRYKFALLLFTYKKKKIVPVHIFLELDRDIFCGEGENLDTLGGYIIL